MVEEPKKHELFVHIIWELHDLLFPRESSIIWLQIYI